MQYCIVTGYGGECYAMNVEWVAHSIWEQAEQLKDGTTQKARMTMERQPSGFVFGCGTVLLLCIIIGVALYIASQMQAVA